MTSIRSTIDDTTAGRASTQVEQTHSTQGNTKAQTHQTTEHPVVTSTAPLAMTSNVHLHSTATATTQKNFATTHFSRHSGAAWYFVIPFVLVVFA